MDPFIISMLISAGSSVIKTGEGIANYYANKKAQKKARGLAEIQRSDDLKQLDFNNKLRDRSLDLNENRLGFGREMLGYNAKQIENQKKNMVEDQTNAEKRQLMGVFGNNGMESVLGLGRINRSKI